MNLRELRTSGSALQNQALIYEFLYSTAIVFVDRLLSDTSLAEYEP